MKVTNLRHGWCILPNCWVMRGSDIDLHLCNGTFLSIIIKTQHHHFDPCTIVCVSQRLLFNTKPAIFSARFISYRDQVTSWWDGDDICSVLDEHCNLNFSSFTRLKIVYRLTCCSTWIYYPETELTWLYSCSSSCMLSKEATNNNLIVFGWLMMGTKLVIYRTGSGHANHYITVLYCKGRDLKQVQGDIIVL